MVVTKIRRLGKRAQEPKTETETERQRERKKTLQSLGTPTPGKRMQGSSTSDSGRSLAPSLPQSFFD